MSILLVIAASSIALAAEDPVATTSDWNKVSVCVYMHVIQHHLCNAIPITTYSCLGCHTAFQIHKAVSHKACNNLVWFCVVK